MSTQITTKAILRAIGCKHLNLIKVTGSAYFYFVYDRKVTEPGNHRTVYATELVYVPRLTSMTLAQWVEDGKAFVAKMEPLADV